MRALGIDYGEKEIGIALSDEGAKLAFPYGVLDNISAKVILKEIKLICDKNNIGKIVVGQSLDYKMAPNPIMKRIEKFKSFIEENLNLSVEFENEVLTTKQAERSAGKSRKTHSSAAALILQSYLDKENMLKS